MRPCMFSAIFLFAVFLCLQVHTTKARRTRDEVAYDLHKPSAFFANLEYELEINSDLTTYHSPHYWGSVLITMNCIKETNKIFLDRHSITINAKTIQVWKYTPENGDKEIKIIYSRNVSADEGYKIKLLSYMKVNTTYKVRLEFSKKTPSENYGFVYADYHLHHPFVRQMLFTSIEKYYAHHVFPCFNEIEMKAKFKVKIGHIKNLSSFTNAKFIRSELVDNPKEWLIDDYVLEELKSTYARDENGKIATDLPKIWVVDEFAKTDFISPFSVALAIVDFNSYEPVTLTIGPPNTDLSEVKVRVWAENDLLNETQVKEVLRVAAGSLEYFSKFFDSTYNAGKLDLLVLPVNKITVQDSYGLIYLGEKVMRNVFVESTHYREDRYFLVSMICQASSRQWIGHVVTLAEWEEEWFYEGLHTYLQRNCILELFEDWKIHVELDLIDSFDKLLRVEERGSNYDPIMQLGTSTTFDEPLNTETKLKTHLIVRMLSFILELKEKFFQKNLADFIHEFQSSNPDLRKLLHRWTDTANAEKDVQILPQDARVSIYRIIITWMSQVGHPLISVSRSLTRTGTVITLRQKPFSFPNQSELPRCWPIPFDIITKNQGMSSTRKIRKWLTCYNAPLEIAVADVTEYDWIIISLGLHVPGRVHYQEMDDWLLIQKLFHNANVISTIDHLTRIQLIHDMFTLAEASYLDYDFVFETIKYISHEKDYGCWHAFYNELNRLHLRWVGTNLFEPFQKLVQTIIEPIFNKEIITIRRFLRSGPKNIVMKIIIQTACTFELAQCEVFSRKLLEDMISLDILAYMNEIPESLTETFYCNAMKDADEKTWDFLMEKYKYNPGDSRILRALGCSRNTSILKKYLKWSTDLDNYDTSAHIALEVFEILSSNNEGYKMIMQYFVKRRWGLSKNKELIALTEFLKECDENITIEDFLVKALEATNQQANLNVLQDFFNAIPNPTKEKIDMVHEAINMAKRTVYWFEKNAGKLSEYFSRS